MSRYTARCSISLTETLKEKKFFLACYAVLLAAGILPFVVWRHGDVVLYVHTHCGAGHMGRLSVWTSMLGSKYGYALLLMVYAVRQASVRTLFIGGGTFLVLSGVVQCLKRLVFPYAVRPLYWLPADLIHLIEPRGSCEHYLSFPSGHTAIAFAMAGFVCLTYRSQRMATLVYVSALLAASSVAFARLCLGYHFYRDVYAGACVGGVSALLTYVMLHCWQPQAHWMTQSLEQHWKRRCRP